VTIIACIDFSLVMSDSYVGSNAMSFRSLVNQESLLLVGNFHSLESVNQCKVTVRPVTRTIAYYSFSRSYENEAVGLVHVQ